MFKCFEVFLSPQWIQRSHHCARRLSSLSATEIPELSVKNERILSYLEGSKERAELLNELKALQSTVTDVPVVVNGKELRTKVIRFQKAPFNHAQKVATINSASPDIIGAAIDESQTVRAEWERTPFGEKINIFLRAADLISGKYRQKLNAATMLGQGKTVIQSEIDAAAELTDFLRFNAHFAKELLKYQPLSPEPSVTRNTFRYRGIEGFIASVSPFNFTAIGGNLASAPILMGNVVLWKPSDTAVLSNWFVFKAFQEAGVPSGVINFLPSKGPDFGNTITASRHLAGINFTGSVPTFSRLWRQIAQNLEIYRNFPRIIGECGGKNYHFVHESADIGTVVASTIRAAFEYSGQKCSACSRLYVPDSIWPEVKDGLLSLRSQLKVSTPLEFDTFTSAVIDEPSFDNIADYIQHAKASSADTILGGGGTDKSIGYFIEPTIIQTSDPKDKLMCEEIFGPILTVYVYPAKEWRQTLAIVDSTTAFALTGAIFANDESFIREATELLKMSAGNFYINDKSTGAVVNQQPFGGGRHSGTNDKAGGPHYLLRWTSPQNVKETFVPQRQWKYPYMDTK